jgi:hypothetical protein
MNVCGMNKLGDIESAKVSEEAFAKASGLYDPALEMSGF